MIKEYLSLDQAGKSVEQQWEDRWAQASLADYRNIVLRSPEWKTVKPFLKTLPLKSRILDAGCGLGYWTAYLRELGYEAVGIDIGRKTIERLRKEYPQARFEIRDMRDVASFEDHSFDGYLSWGVIEHFEDGPGRCLREAWRLLKPGGLLFVSAPFHNLRHEIALKLSGKTELIPDKSPRKVFYQYRFKKSELRTALIKEGFDVYAIYPIHKWHGFLRYLNAFFKVDAVKIGESIFKKTKLQFLRKCWLALFYPVSFLMPREIFSHMVIAVARKP